MIKLPSKLNVNEISLLASANNQSAMIELPSNLSVK